MVRSLIAVVAGTALTFALLIAAAISLSVTSRGISHEISQRDFNVLLVTLATVAALAGGWLAGRIGQRLEPVHALVIGLLDAGNAWPPRRDGDLVFGLGASDMKSGLAVMLALAEDGTAARGPFSLGLVFYDKEEGPDAANGLEPVLDGCPWLARTALGFCL